MAESGGLENRCTLTGTVGSNPTLSAIVILNFGLPILDLSKLQLIAVNQPLSNPKSKIGNPKPGEVQEWLNWQHWKCCVRETVPWVRIPPSPPE